MTAAPTRGPLHGHNPLRPASVLPVPAHVPLRGQTGSLSLSLSLFAEWPARSAYPTVIRGKKTVRPKMVVGLCLLVSAVLGLTGCKPTVTSIMELCQLAHKEWEARWPYTLPSSESRDLKGPGFSQCLKPMRLSLLAGTRTEYGVHGRNRSCPFGRRACGTCAANWAVGSGPRVVERPQEVSDGQEDRNPEIPNA